MGFINPRSEAMAVLEAIAQEATGQVEVEFLRPATLAKLVERLEDKRKPPVDIVHFDGHGLFDAKGNLYERAKLSDPGLTKRLEESANSSGTNMGYLLFEDKEGKQALITAETLGDILNRQKVGLIVLSACQSAAVAGEDAMGSVAARLTHAGIPAVLAMTHSVLVTTAQQLFAKFYQCLVRGEGIGEALDNARRDLYLHRQRGEQQRGQERFVLELHDWFLPALYQAGKDMPLLREIPPSSPYEGGSSEVSPSQRVWQEQNWRNLPQLQEAGFFGRSRELWKIEKWFVQGTQRITISGFGGQGKTYLAIEAGLWLCRTRMFQQACFVDYAAFQGIDAVGLAVSTLGTVLEQSFLDAEAVTAYLTSRRGESLLLILDNLEAIASEPLQELLTVAQRWSEVGDCRLLLTTRMGDFHHPGYPNEGSFKHRALPLAGLAEEDALEYFQKLMKLPPAPEFELPKRETLLELFKLVAFHPLSIGLLARQLKQRRPAELGQRLEALVVEIPDNPLLASLNLSLDRLDAEAQQWLPRLGVFQGGAMEDVLLAVTGLGKADEDPEVAQARQLLEAMQSGNHIAILRFMGYDVPDGFELPEEVVQQLQQFINENMGQLAEWLADKPQTELAAGADESTWQTLRQQLEATGLIQAEYLRGIAAPYLKFHPTLAPALWSKLERSPLNPPLARGARGDQTAQLLARHRQRYYQLARYLYQEDQKNPERARAIAQRELPNLLSAVHGALDAGEEWAVDFVDNVNKFLDVFGLNKDRAELTRRAQQLGKLGSRAWYLARSNQGEQLFSAGRYREAAQVFEEILVGLGEQPSHQRCNTLTRLGRCLGFQGQAARAAEVYRQGLAEAEELEASDSVKQLVAVSQADLGDVLSHMGDYGGARIAYEQSLTLSKEVGDARQEAVINAQLGSLALVQGNLPEAAERYREALTTFQWLKEPASEAIVWHQLGIVCQKAQQWDAAEGAYRESARIKESQGNLAGAAKTWNQLALFNQGAGRLEAAEAWYRKTIEGSQAVGDRLNQSVALSNLANLLQNQPHRLPEARQLAEEALAFQQTLDPAAAEIWKNYDILAKIADKQGDTTQAREYRRLSREARGAFAGTQYQLRKHGQLIAMVVVAAMGNAEVKQQLEAYLKRMAEGGWGNLVAAIGRILEGERDEEVLFEGLDGEDSMIITAILRGIADPETLKPFLEGEEE